jgi:hypothetical protein
LFKVEQNNFVFKKHQATSGVVVFYSAVVVTNGLGFRAYKLEKFVPTKMTEVLPILSA